MCSADIFNTKFKVFSLVDRWNCLSASSAPHRQWLGYSAHPGVHIFSIIQLICPKNKSRCFIWSVVLTALGI